MISPLIKDHKRVLPIASIYENWLETGHVDLSQWLMKYKSEEEIFIFDSVKIGSDFYREIKKEVTKTKKKFEFTIDLDDLYYNFKIIVSELSEGIHLTCLIYKKINIEILKIINDYLKFKKQFKFVIIARKDWSFENTYRSLPDFMRENLFVDFPPSLDQSDTFYAEIEAQSIKARLKRYFNSEDVKSYSPYLKIRANIKYEDIIEEKINEFFEVKVLDTAKVQRLESSLKKKYLKQEILSVYMSSFRLNPLVALFANFTFLMNNIKIHYIQKGLKKFKFFVNLVVAKTFGQMLNDQILTFMDLFYKVRHNVLIHIWHFSPRSIGWLLFRFFFPLRKIYYFFRYQIDKRLLNKSSSSTANEDVRI